MSNLTNGCDEIRQQVGVISHQFDQPNGVLRTAPIQDGGVVFDHSSSQMESPVPVLGNFNNPVSFSPVVQQQKKQIKNLLRNFQKELFEECKDRNNIVFAPTGSGKTWVAAAVAQHVLERGTSIYKHIVPAEKRSRNCVIKKKPFVVFLATRIPLIEQQADLFREVFRNVNQTLKVHKYSSEHRDSLTDGRWDFIYENYDISFMIDTIFLRLLDEKLAYLTDVDLIIFDECHHATGNHSFNRILELYKKDLKESPETVKSQLLGLTASPGADVSFEETRKRTQKLMQAMHSSITLVRNNLDELSTYTKPAVQRIEQYQHSGPEAAVLNMLNNVLGYVEREIDQYRKRSQNADTPHKLQIQKFPPQVSQGTKHRTSPDYKTFCLQQSSTASNASRTGLSGVFHLCHIISEMMTYTTEVGFSDACDYLRTERGLYSDQMSSKQLTDEDIMLYNITQTYSNLIEKELHMQEEHYGREDTQNCTKLNQLFASLRETYGVHELHGTWFNEQLNIMVKFEIATSRSVVASGAFSPTLNACDEELLIVPAYDDSVHGMILDDSQNQKHQIAFLKAHHRTAPGTNSSSKIIASGNLYTSGTNFSPVPSLSLVVSGQEIYFKKIINQTVNRTGSFKAIVFTQTKRGVSRICKVIKNSRSLSMLFTPRGFVGHGSSGEERGMSLKQQNNVMVDFKDGNFNLMVATNVAEEGIDVPICNCVIRYDTQFSVISLIQSRGRARSKHSIFIVIVGEDEIGRYQALEQQERYQLNAVEVLANLQTLDVSSDDASDSDRDTDTDAFYKLQAVKRVSRYCKLQGGDLPDFVFSKSECRLVIPIPNQPPLEKVVRVDGTKHHHQRKAKREVSILACQALAEMGLMTGTDVLEEIIPDETIELILGLVITTRKDRKSNERVVKKFIPSEWPNGIVPHNYVLEKAKKRGRAPPRVIRKEVSNEKLTVEVRFYEDTWRLTEQLPQDGSGVDDRLDMLLQDLYIEIMRQLYKVFIYKRDPVVPLPEQQPIVQQLPKCFSCVSCGISNFNFCPNTGQAHTVIVNQLCDASHSAVLPVSGSSLVYNPSQPTGTQFPLETHGGVLVNTNQNRVVHPSQSYSLTTSVVNQNNYVKENNIISQALRDSSQGQNSYESVPQSQQQQQHTMGGAPHPQQQQHTIGVPQSEQHTMGGLAHPQPQQQQHTIGVPQSEQHTMPQPQQQQHAMGGVPHPRQQQQLHTIGVPQSEQHTMGGVPHPQPQQQQHTMGGIPHPQQQQHTIGVPQSEQHTMGGVPQSQQQQQQHTMGGVPQLQKQRQQHTIGVPQSEQHAMGGVPQSQQQQRTMGGVPHPQQQQHTMGGVPQSQQQQQQHTIGVPQPQQHTIGGVPQPQQQQQQHTMGGVPHPQPQQQQHTIGVPQSEQHTMGGVPQSQQQQHTMGSVPQSQQQHTMGSVPQSQQQQHTMGGVPQSQQQHTMGSVPQSQQQQHTMGSVPQSQQQHTMGSVPQSQQQHTMGSVPQSQQQQHTMGGVPQSQQQHTMGSVPQSQQQQHTMGSVPQSQQQHTMGSVPQSQQQQHTMGSVPQSQQQHTIGVPQPQQQQHTMGGVPHPQPQQQQHTMNVGNTTSLGNSAPSVESAGRYNNITSQPQSPSQFDTQISKPADIIINQHIQYPGMRRPKKQTNTSLNNTQEQTSRPTEGTDSLSRLSGVLAVGVRQRLQTEQVKDNSSVNKELPQGMNSVRVQSQQPVRDESVSAHENNVRSESLCGVSESMNSLVGIQRNGSQNLLQINSLNHNNVLPSNQTTDISHQTNQLVAVTQPLFNSNLGGGQQDPITAVSNLQQHHTSGVQVAVNTNGTDYDNQSVGQKAFQQPVQSTNSTDYNNVGNQRAGQEALGFQQPQQFGIQSASTVSNQNIVQQQFDVNNVGGQSVQQPHVTISNYGVNSVPRQLSVSSFNNNNNFFNG